MWSWICNIADLVAMHPVYALAVVFLAAIIEAVAVLGILIPGTPILMGVVGAAAMAGQSMLPFLVLSVAGAVIGDFVSFWVGSRYSVRLRGFWPFCWRPSLMENAVGFFERHGTFSVALCRFVPFLRSSVPLVAGMAGMRRRRFALANVLSSCVWAPVHIYPAAIAGAAIPKLEASDYVAGAVFGVIIFGLGAGLVAVARRVSARATRTS